MRSTRPPTEGTAWSESRKSGSGFVPVATISKASPASAVPTPNGGHDCFRPFKSRKVRLAGNTFSCKGFYLCPSCSRKRTILFAEHLTKEVLLKLPHRPFVFTMPKGLRPFFRHDRRLFADVSRLVYNILREFHDEAAGRPLLTGTIIAHQTFGGEQYAPLEPALPRHCSGRRLR